MRVHERWSCPGEWVGMQMSGELSVGTPQEQTVDCTLCQHMCPHTIHTVLMTYKCCGPLCLVSLNSVNQFSCSLDPMHKYACVRQLQKKALPQARPTMLCIICINYGQLCCCCAGRYVTFSPSLLLHTSCIPWSCQLRLCYVYSVNSHRLLLTDSP